jgi:hypothetical protein
MPVFHDVAQYSEEYDRLRLGIPTSSNFHKIITPQGKPSKQWREYACVLIAERILQHKIEFYNSPAMERGLIVEAEAADWYEFDQDVTVQRIGIITDEEHTMGCCKSAWNKNPVSGVIGIQSGPPGRRVHNGFHGEHGGRVGDADCGDDCQGSSGLFHSQEADQGDLPRVSPVAQSRAEGDSLRSDRVSLQAASAAIAAD